MGGKSQPAPPPQRMPTSGTGYGFGGDAYPGFTPPSDNAGPDYGALMAQLSGMMPQYPEAPSIDYEAERAAEEQRIGEGERDQLYSDYMNNASTATDYINSVINQERSNAALMGVDYNITDDQKSTRINDYFASIWGEGDQARMESLMEKWGNPEGFEDFIVMRGEGGTAESEAPPETSEGTSGGIRPSLAAGPSTSEDKLGKKSILGA